MKSSWLPDKLKIIADILSFGEAYIYASLGGYPPLSEGSLAKSFRVEGGGLAFNLLAILLACDYYNK
jgi:hypothetical protein